MDARVRGRAALAGVAAAATALGVAELVAVGTGPRTAPVVAVGGVVVDAVPAPVKRFAIDLFGVHDKTALQIGTVVLLAAFAAGVGLAALRTIWYGVAGVALFGTVGAVAAVTRYDTGVVAVAPSLVGALAATAVLIFLIQWAAVASEPATGTATGTAGPVRTGERAGSGDRVGSVDRAGPADRAGAGSPAPGAGAGSPASAGAGAGGGRPDRRGFLTGVAGVVGLAAIAGLGGRALSTRRDVSAARAAVTLPAPGSPAPPVPAGAELKTPGLASYVTSSSDFYRIDTALVVPRVDPRTWQLRIHGRVGRPITLSFDDLLRRPMIERYVTLACVSNEVGGDLISNSRWLGVPVKDLLDEAGPLDGADQVIGRAVDGWTCGTPTAVLRDGRDALLAVGMNGEPLPEAHGFPVRMVVPGLYGYVSACKWIAELELSSFDDYDAYWVRRGWSAQAPIKTQSRIDVPRRRGGKVSAGQVTVAGVAWAQHRGISKVELRVDEGTWQVATLADTVSVDTWRQWRWRWAAEPGEHTIEVRATDTTGATQPEQRSSVEPDGATGYDSITVTVS